MVCVYGFGQIYDGSQNVMVDALMMEDLAFIIIVDFLDKTINIFFHLNLVKNSALAVEIGV